ncbi:Serine/threonine-protein kinase TOR [Glycine soja]
MSDLLSHFEIDSNLYLSVPIRSQINKLMATASQSHRYIGPPSVGPGPGDALNRILADLCTRGNPKEGASLALKKHLEEEARDISGEAFSRFMDQLYDRISGLLDSSDVAENLGALRAIDELIDVALGENASKVSRFSSYMRIVFDTKRDPEILVLASRVLGHLARAGGAMTADEVERQVKIALDWLRGNRVEYRRFAAVLILKEMAENASTVFNVHVPEFVDAIWVALRDPALPVRERAVEALRACLRVIEKRETRWRVQWYYRMFEATQDGLGKNAPVHSIHGSLLAVGELLRNTGEFMMSRYREVAEIVLRYLEHRDRLVRLSITSLLPRIAHFLRDRFVTNYLTICMDHILSVLKAPQDRDSGFIALGEMAGALDGELIHYLPTITTHLREAIAPRRIKPSLEALACVGSIAKAMGSAMEPHVRGLLDIMFSTGLSTVLVEALEQISTSIPSLLPTIQGRLLDSISMVLSKSHYHLGRPAQSVGRGIIINVPQQVSELNGSALVQLALQTLARFNFKGHELLEFARESVVVYLDDEDGATRKDAALCCCRLIASSFSGMACSHFGSSRLTRSGGKRRILVEELVEKLLISAVADADVTVRHSIFTSLHGDRGFDEYLAQADNLSAVFAALNDEDFDVREYAISVAGRLSEKNPAYVLPALRRHLIQLLTYLEQSSADSKCKEESAKLIGCLIRNCERLILPYTAPIHKALVARLVDVNANTGTISGVLVTVGDLARVGGFAMRQYIPELMPLIVEALLDGAAVSKREVAVATLGQVVQSTGYVITPYNEYPQLLGLLLKLLNGELVWSTRREVLKVLGIMGALDPHLHKRNQKTLPGPHGDVTRSASDSSQQIQSMDEFPMDLWPSFASSDDYYSTVAINSLMRILRDPSLASYHLKVVGSLMFIFKSMGLGCVPYLPKVLPDLFHTVRTCEDSLKDFITWKLGTLVSIVRQHIRKYLQDLLSLISEFWSAFTLPAPARPGLGYPVLHLVEQLCLALNDEFRTYLPVILPGCIQVLSDAERCNDYTYVLDILHTLEVFGGTLDEHMHLLLPALIRFFKVDASVDIRRAAIKTLTSLIPRVQVWQALLVVRALVLPPVEDVETWLKFASLCRKSGRISQAKSTLVKLLQYDPEKSPENVRYHGPPQVMLAYLKYQWSLGEDSKRREAFIRLQNLAMELSSAPSIQPVTPSSFTNGLNPSVPLLARVYLNLGSWQWSLSPGLVDESIKDILNAFTKATQYANKWAKAWHKWALFNTAVMSHYTLRGFPDVAAQFVAAAVTGYFHSIACAANSKGVDDSLQDILRLLTLWFNHGATAEVQMALKKGFSLVNINTWLVVLPQIIARIHSNNHAVRELIQSLLVRIGQNHPQALMYPLLVACKSISNLRKAAAQEVVDKVRQHSGVLVDQAQLVSKELIRVAILWHEMWHEALEEASRLYFGEHNIEGMLNVLEPLHEMLEEGAMKNNVTIKERIFIEAYRQELLEAYECCMNYKRTGKDAELTQAWDIYYHVFRKIDKQLQSLTTLDLESVSPELLECRNLELAVPGSYRADAPVVTIASFARQLVVITSKQRPRKLTIHGSDGDDYAFLLKGHEDLRQDERVMQLFGLVNTLLENSPKTAEKDLSIERYAVIPLSPNSGLIEWVPNCDTLHHLIREYRDARKITLNQEHKCMLSFAPDYDHLPLIAKVEVFEHALNNTEGNDLARVLWLKSRTSEIWLERRTNYTRSLAVMSMVGYLLGLGDRHPSNLMLHRGKILHIDFGDCFEASMNREKFPEKVPFRLTRMLVKAMEVSGIEGNFRSTCENVMQVLRTNKDSVMAMMEAFVHDPLINWRLFNFNEVPQMSMLTSNHVPPVVNTEESAPNRELPHPQRGARERELLQAVNQLGDANEVLNERAVVVMARMSNKLTGRDFSTCSSVSNNSPQHAVDHSSLISGDTREVDHALSVKLQVQKLIIQASSHENLCQNYVGWCPFW